MHSLYCSSGTHRSSQEPNLCVLGFTYWVPVSHSGARPLILRPQTNSQWPYSITHLVVWIVVVVVAGSRVPLVLQPFPWTAARLSIAAAPRCPTGHSSGRNLKWIRLFVLLGGPLENRIWRNITARVVTWRHQLRFVRTQQRHRKLQQ